MEQIILQMDLARGTRSGCRMLEAFGRLAASTAAIGHEDWVSCGVARPKGLFHVVELSL